MTQLKIGIGDIGLYVPESQMDMTTLICHRGETHPDLKETLSRAVKKTGQTAFRFPEPWEDTASLAANAAAAALDGLATQERSSIRYLTVGTETGIDHSKPTASYVQGMLIQAGYPLTTSMTTYEVKHACAGGTLAILSNAAMLGFSGDIGERGLTICSDIARYEAPSTAEITQGAGAAAIVVERNPRLIELDLKTMGFFASDVDDFFRPLDSVTAKVKGRYSMECYQEGLNQAFLDYCNRCSSSPWQIIDDTDYIALHVPFPKMPEVAIRKLLKHVCGKKNSEIEAFITRTGFIEAMYLSGSFGNLYTGSLYTYIAALLHQEYRKIGDDIVGKKILIASYGSGNTMVVFSGTIAEGAPAVIQSWNIEGLQNSSQGADVQKYLTWLARPQPLSMWREQLQTARPKKDLFYLKDIGETGLRIYDRA